MALGEDLGLWAPRLCRYARALIAGRPEPCDLADELARAVLAQVAEAQGVPKPTGPDLQLYLYTLLIGWNRERLIAGRLQTKAQAGEENFRPAVPHAPEKIPGPLSPCGKSGRSLLGLALEEREALLLVVLEGFSYAQAARILKISRSVLIARLARAGGA